ncbi:DUF309 domain-containing protein [Gracilibacillus sp. YIM 98692]|uniref:DUF309 domain-containing protein n=1 Tax=Gracilibacillus sp. YIM 98692 TaxID=2663532 RepID=UPI0013D3AC27|nr:DUF309 domain-containing protein [Gracilibacillus sp. YIM 98692]
MEYPKEYITFMIEFHAKRDYFECHEVGEDYWKEKAQKDKLFWESLIQFAVGMYHWRRGNMAGAKKILLKSKEKFEEKKKIAIQYGIKAEEFLHLILNVINKIEKKEMYESLNIPLVNKCIEQCKTECRKKGLQWDMNSDMDDHYLIHKHKLRKK